MFIIVWRSVACEATLSLADHQRRCWPLTNAFLDVAHLVVTRLEAVVAAPVD